LYVGGDFVQAGGQSVSKIALVKAALPSQVQLSVTKTGTGTGEIKSSDNLVNCGTACQGSYATNSTVTLTATPATNSTFAGWSGACSGTQPATTVTMDAAKNCTATFEPQVHSYQLLLNKIGEGRGVVTAKLTSDTTLTIDCRAGCLEQSHLYPEGSSVTLTARATTSFLFKGWTGGGCSGTENPLTLTMDADKTCTAQFALNPQVQMYTLTINKLGGGAGSITTGMFVGGINCGTQCSAAYLPGQTVRLTATPSPLSTFIGWGGSCQGTKPNIALVMNANLQCTAEFLSDFDQVAQEVSSAICYSAYLSDGGLITNQFACAENQARLQEAFKLGLLAMMTINDNLFLASQWPDQFHDLDWYTKAPIGQYTNTIQVKADSVEIQLRLLDNAGQEQEAVIVTYYNNTPPTLPVNPIPIYLPGSFFDQWY